MIVKTEVGEELAGDREFINRLLVQPAVVDAVRLWKDTEEKGEKFEAQKKMGSLLLPSILLLQLGEKVCSRIRTLVGEERWSNMDFMLDLLGNKMIIKMGKDLFEKYKNSDEDGIESSEAKLDNLMNATIDEYETKRMRSLLEYILKQILPDEDFDISGLLTEILSKQVIVDAVKQWKDTEEEDEKFEAQKKMDRLLLPSILLFQLGEKVCRRVTTLVGEERWSNSGFMQTILRNKILSWNTKFNFGILLWDSI